MRILLLGDASNYHRALSAGLAALGHDVTLASDGGGWMCTGRDIDISRLFAGKAGGALYWLKLKSLLRRDLAGYDLVQLASPNFASLRPERLRPVFDTLRRRNGAVFLSVLGTDATYVKLLSGLDSPLKYSEWRTQSGPTPWSLTPESRKDEWTSPGLLDYTRYIYEHLDGAVSALFEYHQTTSALYPELPLAYGGIPIDLKTLPAAERHDGAHPVKIYLAAHRGREAEKGADVLFPLFRRFAEANPGRVELVSPPNMPYSDFLRFLSGTDVLVDQLYSYTPATSALLGMAMGVIPVTGGEPEFAEFVGEKEPLPVLNPDPACPEKIITSLEALLDNPAEMARMRRAAQEFVRKHNCADRVAARFDAFWRSRLN